MACNVTLPNTAATLVKFQLTCLFSPLLTTIAHALAAGSDVNPLGDEALNALESWWLTKPCSEISNLLGEDK